MARECDETRNVNGKVASTMMMMKFLRLPLMVCLLAGFAAVACGDSVQQEALSLNQSAVAAVHDMRAAFEELGEATLIRMHSGQEVDGEEATAKLAAYKNSIETGRSQVEGAALPDLESAREFSAAVIEYFEFHQQQYSQAASQMVEIAIDKEIPVEERIQSTELLFAELIPDEQRFSERINRAQQDFASDVDMTLEQRGQ